MEFPDPPYRQQMRAWKYRHRAVRPFPLTLVATVTLNILGPWTHCAGLPVCPTVVMSSLVTGPLDYVSLGKGESYTPSFFRTHGPIGPFPNAVALFICFLTRGPVGRDIFVEKVHVTSSTFVKVRFSSMNFKAGQNTFLSF
jgi:hypothetical protein